MSSATSPAQDDLRAADHEALIELREKFTEALNNRDFNALKPLVTDSMTFISISNRKLTGIDELEAYWNELFEGDGSILVSMSVAPEADEKTTFFGDTTGVTQGVSNDSFEFRGVGKRELTTRWTAVVEKTGDGWKVARVHMSANVLDNPVLDALSFRNKIITAVGVLLGLVAGAVIFRRRKT